MKIKEWSWKNYKSFGGIEYTIKLNQEKGELILLSGLNGHGKSSVLTSLDVALYATELNKRGTKLAKLNYPNRINGNLKVSCIVENNDNDLIEIERTMQNVSSSIKTKLKINNSEKTPAKIDDYIQRELGMDFSTFKSFCSINVSYFKNFISLTPEDKRMILDKMFNMQQINDLNKILKQLNNENIKEENTIKSKISIYKSNINDLKLSIKTFLSEQESNNEKKIEDIKSDIKKLKLKYKKIEIETNEIDSILDEYFTAIEKLKSKKQNYNRDIKDLREKINLYNLGKCPTCNHELKEELDLLPGLNDEITKTELLINKINSKINIADEEIKEYKTNLQTLEITKRNLFSNITALEKEFKDLSTKEKINVKTFENNVIDLEEKLNVSENEYLEIQKMQYVYSVLSPIWTDNGIKKRIIDSIIEPINTFILEDLERIKVPFRVELDDKFDAHIYDLMTEIDVDSLSSGETRRINLIIMLAYIKMMRLQTNMNLLILDEVFTTIDLNGIDEILYLLKEFAEERLISIFVVHHTELKDFFFDKIMSVDKPYFSILDIKENN